MPTDDICHSKMKKLFYASMFSLTLLIASCTKDIHQTILKSHNTVDNNYEIKKMVSCCGCYAYYVNFFKNQKLTEQFVVELGCDTNLPTKHQFKSERSEGITIANSLIAVTGNSFDYKISPLEEEIFQRLDSLYGSESRYSTSRKIDFHKITGYRRANENEVHYAVFEKLKDVKNVNNWNN